MALWQHFKAISLLQGSTENVCRIYSIPSTPHEAILLCLRVAFANWIEDSVDKISPLNFIRGLQFQVDKAFTKTEPERNVSGTLCSAFYLSKYKNLLSYYEKSQKANDLYLMFIKCLNEEYRYVCLRNMEEGIPIRNFAEAESANVFRMDRAGEINNCKNIINAQVRQLEQLEGGLTELNQSFHTSSTNFEYYNELYYTSYLENENLAIAASQSLLESGGLMLTCKANFETKFGEICRKVALLTEQLQIYVNLFERLHTFSHRGDDFEIAEIENMAKQAEVVIRVLQRVLPCIDNLSVFDFERILRFNHDVIIKSHRERPDLLDGARYTNNFTTFAEQLRHHEWLIYQTFTMVVDRQLPMVIMSESRRPISIRIFNLNSIFSKRFEIHVYLVNEGTVSDIRTKQSLPNPIAHAGKIALSNQEDILATSGKQCKEGTPIKRSRSTEKEVCQPVVTLVEEYFPEKWCYLIKKGVQAKRLTSTEKKSSASTLKNQENDIDNAVTSEKCALLFVMNLHFKNQNKQVWAISLPVTIGTHCTQSMKAWLTIAWDDALAVRNRKGFEVDKKANWSQLTTLLEGTFACMVGNCGLKHSHREYLRMKVQHSLGSAYPDNISRQALLKNNNPFWPWFYNAMLVIKVEGHFHEVWNKGFIEGFIDGEVAKDLLRNSNVKPGTFIIRFSDTVLGSLTLVFLAFDRQIYKMAPLEVGKSKSILDSAKALLGLLNVKEVSRGMDVFLQVYPNISKIHAFKKYYDEVEKKNTKIPKEYVKMLNMLPSSIQTNVENIPSDSGNNVSNTNDGTGNATAMQIGNSASSQSDQSQLNPTTTEEMEIFLFGNNDGMFSNNISVLEDVLGHNQGNFQ